MKNKLKSLFAPFASLSIDLSSEISDHLLPKLNEGRESSHKYK